MTLALTRRGALAAVASFVLPSALAVQGALAQAGVRFRDVQVDVSPLRASAGDPTANWVQRAHESPHFVKDSCWPYFAAKS